MEYYSVIKGNEMESFAETWMDLDIIIQSKVSQKRNQISYNASYIWNLEKMVEMTLFAKSCMPNPEQTLSPMAKK